MNKAISREAATADVGVGGRADTGDGFDEGGEVEDVGVGTKTEFERDELAEAGGLVEDEGPGAEGPEEDEPSAGSTPHWACAFCITLLLSSRNMRDSWSR